MKYFLFFSVLITGACVLILEILATRIIAPFFGNTVYTLSAVLTTILSALGLGYFTGGRLSDKYPSFKLFYFIISLSGISIIFMELLHRTIIPIISVTVADAIGAFYISLFLFFIPAFILGITSPFAVKLSSINSKSGNIGSISGTIFFWSTIGSIIGSLSTGYLLIPNFGINLIILCISLLLVSVGFIGQLLFRTNTNVLKISLFLFF